MADFTRGQTIHFAVTFTDAEGVPFVPTAPKLTVNFPAQRGRVSRTLDLVASGAAWVVDWFSGEASRGGRVDYTAYADAPEPTIAGDGTFELGANAANLQAV